MAKNGSAEDTPTPEGLGYEEALEALEALTEEIEGGDLGLDESIRAYERGRALAARCRAILDRAEAKLESLHADPTDEEPG